MSPAPGPPPERADPADGTGPGQGWTAQAEVGHLRQVLVRSALDAFADAAPATAGWRQLGYLQEPDPAVAIEEHARFLELLASRGAEVEVMAGRYGLTLDSLYVRDASVATDRGIVLGRMGKRARGAEPRAQGEWFARQGRTVIGRIEPPGTLEGGDCAWLDRRTLAVGRSYRTNDEGIRQLRALLASQVELVVVPLPHGRGPGEVFHLMSAFSPLSERVALVHSPWLTIPFRERLLERGLTLVEVPAEELVTQGANALALTPTCCLLPAGNPITRRRLEAAGLEVLVFAGREICTYGGGGPTCLTRPLAWSGAA